MSVTREFIPPPGWVTDKPRNLVVVLTVCLTTPLARMDLKNYEVLLATEL